jgi:hypothetical protein
VSWLKNPSGLGIDLPMDTAIDGTPAKTHDELAATKTMDRADPNAHGIEAQAPRRRHGIRRHGKVPRWLIGTGVKPLWDISQRADGTFARTSFDEERKLSTSAPQASC